MKEYKGSNLVATKLNNSLDIYHTILDFNDLFSPPLLKEISDLINYAKKLHNSAEVYRIGNAKVLGFIAFYANDCKCKIAYISLLAVQPYARKMGVGKKLLEICYVVSFEKGMNQVKLEIKNDNKNAINFFKGNGFEFCGEASKDSMYMIKKL